MATEGVKSLALFVYEKVGSEIKKGEKGAIIIGDLNKVIAEVKTKKKNQKLDNTTAIGYLAASLLEESDKLSKAGPNLVNLARGIISLKYAEALPFMTRARLNIAIEQFNQKEVLPWYRYYGNFVLEAFTSLGRAVIGKYISQETIWKAQEAVKTAKTGTPETSKKAVEDIKKTMTWVASDISLSKDKAAQSLAEAVIGLRNAGNKEELEKASATLESEITSVIETLEPERVKAGEVVRPSPAPAAQPEAVLPAGKEQPSVEEPAPPKVFEEMFPDAEEPGFMQEELTIASKTTERKSIGDILKSYASTPWKKRDPVKFYNENLEEVQKAFVNMLNTQAKNTRLPVKTRSRATLTLKKLTEANIKVD